MPTAVTADQEAKLTAMLDSMTYRERLNLLLALGVPADTVMGVAHCSEHAGWRPMSDRDPLSFEGNSVWCKGCFKWLKA